MNGDSNPYAPPLTEATTPLAAAAPGSDWRIEDKRLWVRDGAVLPDICIWGGDPGRPGSRTRLTIPVPSRFRAGRRIIHISAVQSRYSSIKRALRICSGGMLGIAAALTSSILISGDDYPRTSALISFSLMGGGLLVTIWQGEKLILQITAVRDGWHQLGGIPPVIIARLEEIRAPEHESDSKQSSSRR